MESWIQDRRFTLRECAVSFMKAKLHPIWNESGSVCPVVEIYYGVYSTEE